MAYVDLDNCRRTLSRNEILCTLPRSHCLDIVFPAQSFPEVESVYVCRPTEVVLQWTSPRRACPDPKHTANIYATLSFFSAQSFPHSTMAFAMSARRRRRSEQNRPGHICEFPPPSSPSSLPALGHVLLSPRWCIVRRAHTHPPPPPPTPSAKVEEGRGNLRHPIRATTSSCTWRRCTTPF